MISSLPLSLAPFFVRSEELSEAAGLKYVPNAFFAKMGSDFPASLRNTFSLSFTRSNTGSPCTLQGR